MNIVTLIRNVILSCFIALILSGTLTIYDKDWNKTGYVKDGSIYDKDWNRTGHIKGDKVYDKDWNRKANIKGDKGCREK